MKIRSAYFSEDDAPDWVRVQTSMSQESYMGHANKCEICGGPGLLWCPLGAYLMVFWGRGSIKKEHVVGGWDNEG